MSRVLVLGAGVSGRAAEALLRAQGYDVLVLEGEAAFPCGDRNVAAPAEGAGVGAQPSASETAEGRAFLSPQTVNPSFALTSTSVRSDTDFGANPAGKFAISAWTISSFQYSAPALVS